MTDSFVERFAKKHAPLVPAEAPEPEETVETVGCVGLLRGNTRERSLSLELRQKTGNILLVPYACFEPTEFDPSAGIIMRAGGKVIRIRGRNLGAELRPNVGLISALGANRVAWIQELTSGNAITNDTKALIVESLTW